MRPFRGPERITRPLFITSDHNFFEKSLIESGIDVNIQNNNGSTALITSSWKGYTEIVKMLLNCSDIDVNIRNNYGENFIDLFRDRTIINYSLQKKILENGREDIIIFFDRYGLVDEKIKEENPLLFKISGWGLI